MPTVGILVTPLSAVVTPPFELLALLLTLLLPLAFLFALALLFSFVFAFALALAFVVHQPISMGTGPFEAALDPVDAVLILDRLDMRLVISAVLANVCSSR